MAGKGGDGVSTGYEGSDGADPSGYFGDGCGTILLEGIIILGIYLLIRWVCS